MSNLLTIPLFLVATYIYLFSFWKSLREEAPQQSIFVSELVILASTGVFAIVGLLLTSVFTPRTIFNPSHVWFQLAVVGIILSILFVRRYLSLSFALIAEAAVPGIVLVLSVVSFSDRIGMIVSFITLMIFYVLHKTYKRIHWYKSGRPGFAAYAAIGILFLLRIVFALTGHPMLFSIGQVDILFSAVISFLSFFLIYNQSGL